MIARGISEGRRRVRIVGRDWSMDGRLPDMHNN